MDKYDKPLPETGIRAFIPSDKVYAFKGMTPEQGQFVVTNMQINPKEFFAFVKEYLDEYGAEQEHLHLSGNYILPAVVLMARLVGTKEWSWDRLAS